MIYFRKYIVLFIAISLALTTACSTTTTKKQVVTSKEAPQYKHAQDGNDNDNAGDSPASALVNQGIEMLKNEENSEAEYQFEEAINLDPDYGPAYYWLARARYRLEEIENALGLLKKAESLLRYSPAWMDRIEEFRDYLLNKLNS